MNNNIRLVVWDFDGTVTDAEEEGKPYREGFLADLATLTGKPVEHITELATGFESTVAADPNSHGFIYNDRGQEKIVAPSRVDPYLRMAPVARMIFATLGIVLPPAFQHNLFTRLLYRYNYAKTQPIFRRDAYNTLVEVGLKASSFVVTNSDKERVSEKIRQLAVERCEPFSLDPLIANRLRGDAQKFVDESGSIPGIPESIQLPGLERSVFVQRKHYYRVLDELRAAADVAWEEMMVIGDIFELDLALPYVLGCRVVLIANDHTPPYETKFVFGSGTGHVVTLLSDIPLLLKT